MFDVISFGTATLDVFLKSSEMEIETDEPQKEICVRYGAKLEVNEIHFESGGGGTNSAVTFARQGLKVATVVQIGDDFAGKKILADLGKEQICTGLVNIQKDSFTDYSTILWAPDGGRTILVYRGKTRLEVENVPWDKLDTEWVYVSSLEGNLEIIKNLKLKIKNSQVAWNPGARELQQREKVLELLPEITVLNLNKEEVEELLGEGEKWVVGREVGVGLGISELLRKAQKLPCEYVVITDDQKGAYLWDRASATWWHSGIFENSPRVETTGAGDAFGSGLVTGFAKKESLTDCLYRASANASSVVTQVGAKRGILRNSDFGNWPKTQLKIEKLEQI